MAWGAVIGAGAKLLGSAAKRAATSGVVKRAAGAALRNTDTLLAGAGMLQGAMQDRSARRQEGAALQRAQDLFQERAPMRAMSRELLLQRPRRRSLEELFVDDGNPYGGR